MKLKGSGHEEHFRKTGTCEKCGYNTSSLKKSETPAGNKAWLCATCRN